MYEFEDEWGHHSHLITGPPYDHNKTIDCPACLKFLNTRADAWEKKFAVKYGHNPDTFWIGYNRLWQ